MYLNLIFLPLLSAIICGLFSRKIGFKGVQIISIHLIFPTFLYAVKAFYEVGLLKQPCYICLGAWIQSDDLQVDWSFLFDSLSVTMLVIVTFVSLLVHIYACNYMLNDPHLARFISYLSLFTFFMIILVTSDNFLQLFLGWEGVGICSYLLINFWYTRIQANKAALKAMIINRVGDYSLMLAIIILFYYFKSLDFGVIFVLAPFFIEKKINLFNMNFPLLDVVCILLFIGSVGKSAQIGLHTWLPDAMEGPTPVSALIHAATMVTAGIFLIIRCSPLFEYSPRVLSIIVVVGVLTSFFAATVALVQNDIKKIIAYSTCSQLGYMCFICGLSQYNVGLFHLINHAFFKALLFLAAGAVIHTLNNEQDIRKMGGLVNIMPLTYTATLIGSLSLAGFPFLSGFYSKDVILEVAFNVYSVESIFCYWLGVLTTCFTSIYSFRLLILVFLVKTNSFNKVIKNAEEAPGQMVLVLSLLTMPSIFSGYFLKDIFIGVGSDFFWDSIFILPENVHTLDTEFLPVSVKNIPVISSLFGILAVFVFYFFFDKFFLKLKYKNLNIIFKFFSNKWYFDFLYNEYIGLFVLDKSYEVFFKTIDKGFLEVLGPSGITSVLYKLSNPVKNAQSGFLYSYLSSSLILVLIIITY